MSHTASTSEQHDCTWKLLHPELLTLEELISILTERHVHIDESSYQNKEKLVEMFKRVAMPQSQRPCFQDRNLRMEVDKSPTKISSSPRQSLLRARSEAITCVQNTNSKHVKIDGDIASATTTMKLKRDISQISEESSTEGSNSKRKREIIIWP